MAHTEDEALETLEGAAAGILAAIPDALPEWAAREAARILDAWGRHGPDERARLVADARDAGERAARRIVADLEGLFALDPEEQRVTPLQIVRSAHREVTEVLAGAGVPAVERDEFDARAWPDDHYGLVPASLRDVGGDDLADLQLTWGVAKAAVHKARRG